MSILVENPAPTAFSVPFISDAVNNHQTSFPAPSALPSPGQHLAAVSPKVVSIRAFLVNLADRVGRATTLPSNMSPLRTFRRSVPARRWSWSTSPGFATLTWRSPLDTASCSRWNQSLVAMRVLGILSDWANILDRDRRPRSAIVWGSRCLRIHA